MEIVKKLMVHMDKAEGTVYRDELLSKIILICSQNNYQFITNFEWYITVLVELANMEFGSKQGKSLHSEKYFSLMKKLLLHKTKYWPLWDTTLMIFFLLLNSTLFLAPSGHVIASQLMDVCIRVQAIRKFAVVQMAELLEVVEYTSTKQLKIMQEVMYAAAWLCGEFVRYAFTIKGYFTYL